MFLFTGHQSILYKVSLKSFFFKCYFYFKFLSVYIVDYVYEIDQIIQLNYFLDNY